MACHVYGVLPMEELQLRLAERFPCVDFNARRTPILHPWDRYVARYWCGTIA